MEIDQSHGPYDMDEYGHTTVEDDLPAFPMVRFVGQRILAAREIRYQHDNYDFAIGITLQFETGSIRVLNLADEIVLAHDQHLARSRSISTRPRRPPTRALRRESKRTHGSTPTEHTIRPSGSH